jgi:hypothetical protein
MHCRLVNSFFAFFIILYSLRMLQNMICCLYKGITLDFANRSVEEIDLNDPDFTIVYDGTSTFITNL